MCSVGGPLTTDVVTGPPTLCVGGPLTTDVVHVVYCDCSWGAIDVILHVSDAGYVDNKAGFMNAATPQSVTPKLQSSKLILSTASVRVHRCVCMSVCVCVCVCVSS